MEFCQSTSQRKWSRWPRCHSWSYRHCRWGIREAYRWVSQRYKWIFFTFRTDEWQSQNLQFWFFCFWGGCLRVLNPCGLFSSCRFPCSQRQSVSGIRWLNVRVGLAWWFWIDLRPCNIRWWCRYSLWFCRCRKLRLHYRDFWIVSELRFHPEGDSGGYHPWSISCRWLWWPLPHLPIMHGILLLSFRPL